MSSENTSDERLSEDQLDAEQKLKRINAWQNNSAVHELTCGRDSSHAPLQAEKSGDVVILTCPDCDYVQTNIPNVVFGLDS